ncbi:hypothetical protein Fot_04148 [Forsythia ovata]|uniref:Uncharacterized protein n=1 Tax=Forsythia ovata TaxID=205694 RepID=A0ABD1XBQ6_9LAMI
MVEMMLAIWREKIAGRLNSVNYTIDVPSNFRRVISVDIDQNDVVLIDYRNPKDHIPNAKLYKQFTSLTVTGYNVEYVRFAILNSSLLAEANVPLKIPQIVDITDETVTKSLQYSSFRRFGASILNSTNDRQQNKENTQVLGKQGATFQRKEVKSLKIKIGDGAYQA